MSRQMPYYCEHGVCVDGGDFVDNEECNDCMYELSQKGLDTMKKASDEMIRKVLEEGYLPEFVGGDDE